MTIIGKEDFPEVD